jgi:CheY-like chemotaxis protein
MDILQVMSDDLNEIERLRRLRQRPQRDLSIHALIESAAENARKTQKRLGAIIDLWEELMPTDMAARTRIQSLRGGTLHVAVDSSATSYELDRLLREGLEAELRSRYRGTLIRVRLRVSPNDAMGIPSE